MSGNHPVPENSREDLAHTVKKIISVVKDILVSLVYLDTKVKRISVAGIVFRAFREENILNIVVFQNRNPRLGNVLNWSV